MWDSVRRLFHRITWPFETPYLPKYLQADLMEVQEKVPNGHQRVSLSPVSLALAEFPQPRMIPYDRQLMSDYGVATEFPEIEAQFYEEVAVFQEALEEPEPEGSDVQAAIARMNLGLDKRVYAFTNWERYAFPFRAAGDQVVHISAPRDLMGSPIIDALPVSDFVCSVALRSAAASYRVEQLKAQRNFWMIAFFVAAAVAYFALFS